MKLLAVARSAAAVAMTLLLAACHVDGVSTMRVSEIRAVAKTSAPMPVQTSITAAFASKVWCRDESAMVIGELARINTPVQATGCAGGDQPSTGTFMYSTSLVKTGGGSDVNQVVQQVLGSDAVKYAVFPHGTRKDLLSVGIFANFPELMGVKNKLLAMPVFQRGGDLGEKDYTITIAVTNDTAKSETFYLKDVSAATDPSYQDSVLTIPPGGTDTISLSPDKIAQLRQQGYVNFFAMKSQ